MSQSLRDRVWNWIATTESLEWDFSKSAQRDEIMQHIAEYQKQYGLSRILGSSQNPYKVYLHEWDELPTFVPKP